MRRVFALLLIACLGASGARAQCLHYEPSVVTLQGVVSLKFFYGPPNFGENPKTDAKELEYLLTLDAPICVSADGQANSPNNEAESGITAIQLLVTSLEFGPVLKRALNHRIRVSGTLHHEQTSRDHTKVVLILKGVNDAV